ncbi:MAG: polysaccharide export protein [Verrucomicrobiae bacterium]|nr:polysaccharide export protein [Verrucomicrobiae bacterium]MDW7979170.1 polysaccharide biosynthesis/export family protein [Verrucomicrobiales bacterium]
MKAMMMPDLGLRLHSSSARTHSACILALGILVLCAAGCAVQSQPQKAAFAPVYVVPAQPPPAAGAQRDAEARAAAAAQIPREFALAKIQEGDVIRVMFEVETNLNTVVKVQLDGTITMPLIGTVRAAGKTATELQAELMQAYERVLKVNQLTVGIVSTSASVYVSGAVLKPGRIPMDRPLTALDAIMEAGGFDFTRARPSAVTVLRIENGTQVTYRLNLKRALEGKPQAPFYLKPFDIVHVPEKVFNF